VASFSCFINDGTQVREVFHLLQDGSLALDIELLLAAGLLANYYVQA